jgi:hypothetical protein
MRRARHIFIVLEDLLVVLDHKALFIGRGGSTISNLNDVSHQRAFVRSLGRGIDS